MQRYFRIRLQSLHELRWRDGVLRFLFGGTVTLITGWLSHRYGPTVAGLFLAFPAIFPAAVTLIAKEEREEKAEAGYDGTHRGRMAAAIDAYGTALGTLGLLTFGLFAWHLLPMLPTGVALLISSIVWLAAVMFAWIIAREI
jgi:hypothetical protein